jgi:protein SCO1
MQEKNFLSTALALVLMGLMTWSLAGCGEKSPIETPSSFHGIDLTGADYAKDLQLPDFDGQMRRISDFKGKVVVVFFGFTQCPEVCPTSMQELVEVKKALGPDGERLQALFVTVDPERDTPEVLKAYMSHFDPGFLGLRGSAVQLAQVAKDFKVYYKKVDGATPTSYSMDHSAASYIYDPSGRLRVYTRYKAGGAGAKTLEADIRTLLAGG